VHGDIDVCRYVRGMIDALLEFAYSPIRDARRSILRKVLFESGMPRAGVSDKYHPGIRESSITGCNTRARGFIHACAASGFTERPRFRRGNTQSRQAIPD